MEYVRSKTIETLNFYTNKLHQYQTSNLYYFIGLL